MKRTYVVQLIIDAVVILLGFFLYTFTNITELGANMMFFMVMGVYSGLELCEYIFDYTKKEPLYVFFASFTASFAALFLRGYDANYVLSITIAVWLLMYAIIKMINLEDIYKKKSNLFMIKLSSTTMVTILGIFVSINMYFRIELVSFMLALLFLAYGSVEAFCDFMTYLSEDTKFLKE